jgi:endonuclease/exonuclease/phosphatase (EEP) superfamily protein YafD
MKITLEIISWLMLAFSLMPMIRTTKWWVRVLDFPRFQIFIISVVLLVLYLALIPLEGLRNYLTIGALGITLLIQSRYIFPFTPIAREKALRGTMADPDNVVRLLIANVRMENRKTDNFLAIVREVDPDLILVNEPDHYWAEKLSVLDQRYPHSVKHPLPNTYGMMFFSKLKLVKSRVQFLVEEDIPSIHAIVALRSGQEIEFCGVHPRPPMVASDTDKREAELLLVGKSVIKSKRASIVAGDLNDVGWSHTTKLFQKISGLLDPRLGRGFFNTYNVFIPFFRYPLDHIFYDPRFRLIQLKRLSPFGSDHYPILVELAYQPDKQAAQEPERADREEKAEAEELIEKGLEEQ